MTHTDANVQPQGNPWDQNDNEKEEQPFILSNPLRPYLEALAADLTAGMATLNWQPEHQYVKGEVAAMKRAMARTLVHSYGLEYLEAFRRVEKAAEQQVRTAKITDPGWERTKRGVFERVVVNLLDPEWVVPA